MTTLASPSSPLDTLNTLPSLSRADRTAWGALALRASLGTMWIAHVALKILVFTLPGTAQFFASVGLPAWLAYPVAAAELLGGAMILLGVHAGRVALLLMPILAGALWVHAPNGWVFTSSGGGWEYPAFLLAASLALWLLGDGAYALRPGRHAQGRGFARDDVPSRGAYATH